jgi:hypothetical protein
MNELIKCYFCVKFPIGNINKHYNKSVKGVYWRRSQVHSVVKDMEGNRGLNALCD